MFRAAMVPLWAGEAITRQTCKALSGCTQGGKVVVMVTTEGGLIGVLPLMCGVYGLGLMVSQFVYTLEQRHALPPLTRFKGAKHEKNEIVFMGSMRLFRGFCTAPLSGLRLRLAPYGVQ